jgi:hypothetical protein
MKRWEDRADRPQWRERDDTNRRPPSRTPEDGRLKPLPPLEAGARAERRPAHEPDAGWEREPRYGEPPRNASEADAPEEEALYEPAYGDRRRSDRYPRPQVEAPAWRQPCRTERHRPPAARVAAKPLSVRRSRARVAAGVSPVPDAGIEHRVSGGTRPCALCRPLRCADARALSAGDARSLPFVAVALRALPPAAARDERHCAVRVSAPRSPTFRTALHRIRAAFRAAPAAAVRQGTQAAREDAPPARRPGVRNAPARDRAAAAREARAACIFPRA